ncbi:ADP-ribosyltransferase [Nocardia sp. NPDC005978]|uniref:ADP-ribosyltransferase n=1 Tax=Nocardia sp. NPDC005978 TaxID=3156725 RepID=UPI0033B88295
MPNLDTDFAGQRKMTEDSDADSPHVPDPHTDQPESKSPPDTRTPEQDPDTRQPAPDRSDAAPTVDTHLDEVLASHPDPESVLTDHDGTATVAAIADQMGITDPEQRQALQDVFEASRDNAAPFIVKVASDMLTNLKAAVALNPDLKVVFLGRDGHSLAMAMSQLDPAFFAQHGHEVTLSRALVETAVQDLEKNAGLDASDAKGFRGAKGKIDPDSVDGAFARLTAYFQELGIPIGEPGSDVALVDTSYKGTVQELLNAIFPETNFQGHFMFYAASPADQHPDNKVGYALDLDVENGNRGYPVSEMPADPAKTFQQQDALGSIEEVFHGPLGSPKSIGPDGLPSQELQRFESDPLVGLNPATVADKFSDPLVREAAKRVALLPIAQIAHDIATQRAAGIDVDADLQAGYDNYVNQVRAWVEGDPSVDPKFAEVMDSFVRRSDKSEVKALAELIDQAGLDAETADRVWREYADSGTTLAEKKAFVQQFTDAHPNPESTREISLTPEQDPAESAPRQRGNPEDVREISQESDANTQPATEVEPDVDRPSTLTDHLKQRFEQIRSLATDVAMAYADATRASELPGLRQQFADLLGRLGLLNPATAETPWNLLRGYQPELAAYVADNHGFLLPDSDTATTSNQPSVDESVVQPQQDVPESVTPEQITPAEIEAINKYTDPDADVYTDLNNRLRNDIPLDPEQQRIADDISAGLSKLPPFEGTVWRATSLDAEQLARYVEGAIVPEPSFTSTSADARRTFTGNVEFVMHSKSGRDVTEFSSRPQEKEVLFDRNATFEVRGVVHDPNANLFGVTRVYLYETTAAPDQDVTGDTDVNLDQNVDPIIDATVDPPVQHAPDRTAIGDSPEVQRAFQNVRNEGAHDVVVHGNRFGNPTVDGNVEITPQQVIDAVRNNPDYVPGTPIRLLSCFSANDIGFAQQIADALGVPVLAPTDAVGVRSLPDSPAMIPENGDWKVFRPTQPDGTTPAPTIYNPAHETDGPLPRQHESRDGWDVLGQEPAASSQPDPNSANPQPNTTPPTGPPVPEPVTATEIESKYGIPVENQRKIQEYADANNLRFDVRPTNPDAVRHLKEGAMPKPMSIKDKTINDLDIALGAPADAKGLVGHFAPGMLELPDTSEMSDADVEALKKRLADREGDYAKYHEKMEEYREAGKFDVREDGVVVAKVGDQEVPVTGDHDMFDLRHADGTRLSPEELAHHEAELSKLDAGIMHGPHVYWNPEADQRVRNFEPIINDHRYDPNNPNAEPLIRFEPNQDPKVVWSERDVAAIDRDMTPWHLESDLAKIDPTRSDTAPADIARLRELANELAGHPDFDHPTYRSLLEGTPATPDVEGSPAHKIATIALEARNGTDPADIVRMVEGPQPAVTTTAETLTDTSSKANPVEAAPTPAETTTPDPDSTTEQPNESQEAPDQSAPDPHAQEVRDAARLRTDGRDALASNSPSLELTNADVDRIERIEALRDDLTRSGVDPADVKAKLRTELEDAGVLRDGKKTLRNDGPAMQRRALMTEAGLDVDAVADEIGLERPLPPRTDNEGLPLRGEHADPDVVPRRDVTFEEVDAVVPDALIRALEKFGVSREVAVQYIVDHHNDRSRQRYLPDVEGLARKYDIPLGDVLVIDLYTTKLYYEELNRRLRADMDVDSVAELQQAVNESLSKLPPAAVPELFRSLSIDTFDLADFLAKYTTDAVIDWEAFTSVADEEGGTWWGEPKENILFKITGGVAFDISDFADGLHYKDPANEGKELLLPAGKVVRVESVTPHVLPDGTTGYVIELEVLGAPGTTTPATTTTDPATVPVDPSTPTPTDTTQDTPESEQASVPEPTAPSAVKTPASESDPESSTPKSVTEPSTSDPDSVPAQHPREPSTFEGEATDAGRSFHNDPEYADLARRVPNDPDYMTVDAHIDADGNVRVGDRTLTPEQFADLLRRSGWDGRTPIRLIGCEAATNGFATRLARALGVDVLAPTKPAWTDPDGNVYSSSTEIGPDGQRRPRIPPDGEWQTHHPNGTFTRTTDDGFAPGTPDDSKDSLDGDQARDRAASTDPEYTPAPTDRTILPSDPAYNENFVDWNRPTHQPPDPDNPSAPRRPIDVAPEIKAPHRDRETVPDGNSDPSSLQPMSDPDAIPTPLRNLPGHNPLRPWTAYPVANENGTKTTFFTDGDGVVKWVEATGGSKDKAIPPYGQWSGFNPDLSFPLLPNAQYRVPNFHNSEKMLNFETNQHGQTVAMTGEVESKGQNANFRDDDGKKGAQQRAYQEGEAAYPNNEQPPRRLSLIEAARAAVKWAGGHLIANELGGLGEYLNMHPQMAASNSGNLRDRWTHEASWRAKEKYLVKFAEAKHQDIRNYQVKMTRGPNGVADEVMMRWQEVTYARDAAGKVVLGSDNLPLVEKIETKERVFPGKPELTNYGPDRRYANR